MKKFLLLGLIPLLFVFAAVFPSSVIAQENIPGLDSIKSSDLLETVSYLASPGLEGRAPASDGYYKAAIYMVQHLANLGLKSPDSLKWFQYLPVEYCNITETPELSLVKKGEVLKVYKPGEDFVCRGQTGFGDVTGSVVFCGYGISEPALGYDDYSGADVKDKIVLVFKQNPSWKLEGFDGGIKITRYKANKAAEHGAKAIVFVSTPLMKDPQKPIGSIMDGDGYYDEDFPEIQIDISIAEELLEGSTFHLKQLQQLVDSTKKPFPLPLSCVLHVKVKGIYSKEKKSMNVVGILPGTDPELSKEYVVVCAHLDHVGKQGPGLYFPGANDNASGSAAVLEIAQAFKKAGVKPKRSVIFVLFTSEEQGLFGSKYFVEHCPVPKEKIVAAINLDCVGVGDSIQAGGGKSSPLLWDIARDQDSLTSKLLVKSTWKGGGADLEAFYQAGIPGLYFVSRNSYTHLHMPSDKPETLNKDLYEKLVKLAYSVVYKVAMGNYQREVLIK